MLMASKEGLVFYIYTDILNTTGVLYGTGLPTLKV